MKRLQQEFSGVYIAFGIIIILVLLFGSKTHAQQHIGFTQFMWNQSIVNPAFSGSKEALSARAFYRSQWAGFEGAPVIQSISVHSPVFNEEFGAGLNVMRDQLGISDKITIAGSFSYRMKLSKGRLGFGLSGEYALQQMAWSTVHANDSGDEALPYADVTVGAPNFGFGIHYDTHKFFLGLAVPELLENDIQMSQSVNGVTTYNNPMRHIYLMSGYIFDVNKTIKIKPSVMVRYVNNAPVQIDANLSALFNEKIWVGVGYRHGDSADLMLQYNFTSQLKAGYSYDFTLTKIQGHAGSHEIFLGFDLQKKSDGFNHPRYF